LFPENILRLLKLLPELFIPRNRPSRRADTVDEVLGLFRGIVGPVAMDLAEILAATFQDDEGPETGELSESDMRRIAVHEAGRAVIYLHFFPDRLLGVQIWNRQGRGGEVQVKAQAFDNREDASALIATYYGGLAAEELYIEGGISDGCELDIATATNIAIAHVDLFGVHKGEAPISYTIEGTILNEKRINAITAVLLESFRKAQTILKEEKAAVLAIAEALLQKKRLDHEELLALHAQHVAKKT
jgi:ATP-dependent Zn protease